VDALPGASSLDAHAIDLSSIAAGLVAGACLSREGGGAAHVGQYAVAVRRRDQCEPGVVRHGPFWDVLGGRRDPPPAAVLLGWELVAVDPDAGTIEVSFTATEQFLNPAGDVQGGFLAAMLDDTLGPALVATLGEGEWAPPLICRFSSSDRRSRRAPWSRARGPAGTGHRVSGGRVAKRGRGRRGDRDGLRHHPQACELKIHGCGVSSARTPLAQSREGDRLD
jgi:hypothetical protein